MLKDFCVTAYGPAATRWFSFVLASHKDVYVGHGSYPFNSVVNGSYQEEKALLSAPINVDAVTRGRKLDRFIKSVSVDDLYAEYRRLFPNYLVYGNVHSFVPHELFTNEGFGNLDLTLYNLIRNPINYIASHSKLVIDAKMFSEELHDHYSNFFNDLFLIEYPTFMDLIPDFNPDDINHIAHVLSCYTIKRQRVDLHEFSNKLDNILMESLVSDLDYLKDACEKITGLTYQADQLSQFISGGALNSHRKKATSSAQITFENWSYLYQLIFYFLINEEDIEIYKKNGYDLSYLF